MSQKKDTTVYQALQYRKEALENTLGKETISLEMIGEEPFLIRIEGQPYSVVMRTPGDEIFHAAGFCLGEGIAGSPDDIITIDYDQYLEPNIADVWLKPERKNKIHEILDRKIFVSQTSCGICGKEMIRDLYQKITTLKDDFKVEISGIFNCINKLYENQIYYQSTRGSHAAILFDSHLEKLSFAEDVGRHNALDKAVGNAFMDKKLSNAKIIVLSSRISYELIQKTARAHIPVIIGNSRPTALAVEMGKSLNMTLAFPAKGVGLIIVCGEERILTERK